MSLFTMRSKTLCVMLCLAMLAGCSEAKKAVEKAKEAGETAKQTVNSMSADFTAATEKAGSALKDVAGGPEVLTQITDAFKSAGDSLSSVKDSDTAKAAATKLDELGGKVGGWEGVIGKLPEAAQKAIRDVIEQGKTQLAAVAQKALAIPGAEAIIKPAVDGLMSKLTALTAAKPS